MGKLSLSNQAKLQLKRSIISLITSRRTKRQQVLLSLGKCNERKQHNKSVHLVKEVARLNYGARQKALPTPHILIFSAKSITNHQNCFFIYSQFRDRMSDSDQSSDLSDSSQQHQGEATHRSSITKALSTRALGTQSRSSTFTSQILDKFIAQSIRASHGYKNSHLKLHWPHTRAV